MKYFIEKSLIAFVVIFLIMAGCGKKQTGNSEDVVSEQAAIEEMTVEKLGWEMSMQTYTFREFTLEEAFAKMNSLGLHYAEIYNGQEIGGGVEGKVHFTMSPELRQKTTDMAIANDIEIVQFGVSNGKDEEEWKQHFEFAKAMGIKIITSEPNREDWDLVNDLAKQYGVRIAIHNHPQPSLFWNPDVVLEASAGREMIGSCADVGHWSRSGLDPVECMKKLEGKIFTFHIKDVDKAENSAEDVVWGTGICDIAAVIAEAQRQGFKGVWSIEYEANPENNMKEIGESLDYFNKVVGGLK
ncbi:MAG: sugar phosphate isomerase/epimerase [Cyclobacteriaceae bacterium]|nr:sugar phosphate isomerase/epimerase [Cyclobacteriaceae bacterium]